MVKESREKRIIENIPLVHSIANRFRSRDAEYDDLFQAGCLGLVKAVDGFDETKGFQFSTYAVPVIMGEIKRLFRDGGAIKVSRALKEKSVKLQCVREKFVKKEMREPTVSELSAITGMDTSELAEILGVLNPVLSLSIESEDGNDEMDIPFDDSEEMYEKLALDRLLDTLDKRDRELIRLRYYCSKTQAQTGKALGISQVQVSRREKAILQKLRYELK